MNRPSKHKIVLFKRKPYPGWYYSIETIFNELVNYFPTTYLYEQRYSQFYSKGIIKRLYNMVNAMLHQGDVNHVTGDEHYLTLLLKKNKTILTIHDCRFLEHPHFIARKILTFFWLTLPVKRCRWITVISEKTKQDIINNCKVNPEKIVVIPNFVFSHFSINQQTALHKIPVLLQVGTTYNKNLERVAAAIEGIACTLKIIGKPSDEQIKLLNQKKINYTFYHQLSTQAINEVYASADVVVFASTIEGFGLPIIEANKTGRALLTSDCSPMKEIANGSACLVDPLNVDSIRQGIIKVLEDESYRISLIEKGIENAKKYSIDEVAKQYLALYQTILQPNEQEQSIAVENA